MYLPTNDFIFKKTFSAGGQEDMTKALIEAILDQEFQEVQLANTYSIEKYKVKEKPETTEVDLLARDAAGRYVTIEMQVHRKWYFLERVQYYAREAFRKNYGDEQTMLDRGNRYSSLRQIYSINILDCALFPEENAGAFELLFTVIR